MAVKYTVATKYKKIFLISNYAILLCAAETKTFMSLLVWFLIDVLVHKKVSPFLLFAKQNGSDIFKRLACMYMLFYMHHASDASRMSHNV